jgi:hypothetical protein
LHFFRFEAPETAIEASAPTAAEPNHSRFERAAGIL